MEVLERYYDEQAFMLYALFASVPGRSSGPRILFVTFGTLVLIFATTFQTTKMVTSGWDVQLCIDVLPTVTAVFVCLVFILYLTFATQDDYKALLSLMLTDLAETRCEGEDAIRREYADGAKVLIKAYKAVYALTICGMPLSGFIPYFLDLIVPLNETRQRQLIYDGDLFIDENKYFYYLYFLESCSVLVVCIVVGVSEMMSVIIGQHLCGMFAGIGYRLENITRVKGDERWAKLDRGDLITRRVRDCIRKHQAALEFYDTPLSLVLVETFCALTVALVQVTDPDRVSAKMVIFTIIQISQFLIISVIGQSVINASESLTVYAYNAEWDVCSGKVRRLLQLIIRRSSEACVVMAMRMYTLSIENFMSVMQTATSFYMAIRQAQ